MIYHNIERLDVSVHYPVTVAVIQCLKKLVHVYAGIFVGQFLKQNLAFNIWDVLKYQTWSFTHRLPHHVVEFDNVRTAEQSLEDFDLSKYFFCPDWFQNFDYALLVIFQIAAFIYF